jgi:hypothetical protein
MNYPGCYNAVQVNDKIQEMKMRPHRIGRLTKPVIIILIVLFFTKTQAEIKQLPFSCFAIDYQLKLPGQPELIYDAISGDISGWWDHSFSEKPYRFYIEARPGGGFYEIFNQSGDGVQHATVIAAERGKLLRFDGPLGLSGRAIAAVYTYQFEPVGEDSTLLKFEAHFFGETQENLPETIEQVWYHFLFARFKPYIEKGTYLKK